MKNLKEYIEALNRFVKQNPEALEMRVFTASDDEGNHYNSIQYAPSIALKGEVDVDFKEGMSFEEYGKATNKAVEKKYGAIGVKYNNGEAMLLDDNQLYGEDVEDGEQIVILN